MKNQNEGKILLIVLLIIVSVGVGCFVLENHETSKEQLQGASQNISQSTEIESLPKDIKVDDIEIAYLCKTTYGVDDKEYKTKDLFAEEAKTFVKGIAQLASDSDCSNSNNKIQEEGLQYKYLIQGYNAESYIEFRIEVYVYKDKTTVVNYDKLKDYYNPEEYILDNDEVVNYIVKYMDEMQGDVE